MTGLSEQQLTTIRAQLGGTLPATDGLLLEFAEQIRDRREHDHASSGPDWDWYCLNASGWLGDKAPTVLRRLLDAEAEVERLRSRVAELEAIADEGRVIAGRAVQCGDCGAVGDVDLSEDGLLYLYPSGQIGHSAVSGGVS